MGDSFFEKLLFLKKASRSISKEHNIRQIFL